MDKIEKDIALTTEQYPKLTVYKRPGKLPALKGQIDIVDEEGTIIESFDVRIQYTRKFPNAYPLVYETGNRFDKENRDLHVNANGTLCLNVEQDEVSQTRYGITTLEFIEKVLIPNLAWRVCKVEGLSTDLKEYRHGLEGIIDGYKETIGTENLDLVVLIIDVILKNRVPSRNEWCLCGSQKKYKFCHYDAVESLKLIKKDVLQKHLGLMKSPSNL